MCGICGAVSVDRDRPVDPRLIRAMLGRLGHRGPDGEGTAQGKGAALGHRRLAIIDLSPAAAQPLFSEDESIFAVVNGEIYNHRDLRAWLESKGHRFRSRSDSEVVVHLYEEEGPELVRRLEGMFALAIWDARTECLLLARDRLGEKPLYYHENTSRILFASEIGALLADRDLVPQCDDLAIHHYLSFRFVPSPYTGFRGVRKLPPGHRLRWERGRATIERYYAPPRPRDARAGEAGRAAAAGEPERAAGVRAAIERAVTRRLESDVPLGVLLSGGLDSAIVAHEASRRLGGSLRTFTVKFEETAYDESAGARLVASKIGSQHAEVTVRPDIVSDLPEIVARFGEPFGDSSCAAVWMLAREVRRHVTVALGGDGGDELFGGYDRYRALRLAAGMRRSGAAPVIPLARRLARLVPLARGRRNLAGRLDRFARSATLSPRDANCAWLACFSEANKRLLYAGEFGGRMVGVDSMNLLRRFYEEDGDFMEDVVHADLSLGLPDDLLFKVDVASMASGLEVRSPFLAPSLVELAIALPSREKVGRRAGKKILREAYAGLLPEATLRGRKAGFGVPVDEWLRGPLREMAHDLLLDGRFVSRGHFDGRAVMNLLKEHQTGRANHDDRIWALLCLEIWFRTFLEGAA